MNTARRKTPPTAAGLDVEDNGVHVCSLLDVHDVLEETRARFLVSIINAQLMLATPHRLDTANHLKLACNDISRPQPGLIAPSPSHAERLIAFVRTWDRQGPLVIHCWAGISRSTAAAFVALCTLNPQADEHAIARELRENSVTAYPNRLLVALADEALGRSGRMIRAVEAIGAGQLAVSEMRPFRIDSWHSS